MIKNEHKLAHDMAEVIQTAVTNTLNVMFNTHIDLCENQPKIPSSDDFVYCSELVQDDARARILFVFDRALIEKLVRSMFPNEDFKNPMLYESTASEIVNIVGNCLKQYLNLHGYHLEMALPYSPDRDRAAPAGDPLIKVAFSLKNKSAIGIDFYLRSA